jgi:hypothetical protein
MNQLPAINLISNPVISPFDIFGSPFGLNFGMNFRSQMGDDIISQIMRLSEQERGRMGTPPASKEVVENLPEV